MRRRNEGARIRRPGCSDSTASRPKPGSTARPRFVDLLSGTPINLSDLAPHLGAPYGSRMFDTLGDKLDLVFKRLRGHGRVTERHMTEALREIRMALLEADVALPVVHAFVERVREQALGEEVLRRLT